MSKKKHYEKPKKTVKSNFDKEYQKIMKGSNLVHPQSQWTEAGDVFVKFSMYQNKQTVAHPHTII